MRRNKITGICCTHSHTHTHKRHNSLCLRNLNKTSAEAKIYFK